MFFGLLTLLLFLGGVGLLARGVVGLIRHGALVVFLLLLLVVFFGGR